MEFYSFKQKLNNNNKKWGKKYVVKVKSRGKLHIKIDEHAMNYNQTKTDKPNKLTSSNITDLLIIYVYLIKIYLLFSYKAHKQCIMNQTTAARHQPTNYTAFVNVKLFVCLLLLCLYGCVALWEDEAPTKLDACCPHIYIRFIV